MAVDRWNGNGDWTGNPGDWSTGAPPGSTDTAEIQSGTDNLTTSASVASVIAVPGSALQLGNGASLTTTAGLNNGGYLGITGNGDTVSVGGTLSTSSSAATSIGGTGLGATTTVTAAGLNNSGSLVVQGNAASGATSEAILDITGAVPATVTGSVRVLGDADLELANQITAIGSGAFLQVDGAEARVSLGSGTTSSALSTLSLNNGTANFDGNCSLGAGGTTITTTTGFTNNGSLWVDIYGGDGATTVTFGGTLTNDGTAIIGNTSLGANAAPGATTTVTAGGLANNGSLTVQGNAASGATNEAILDITGAVPATVTGSVRVLGDADLEVGSAITSIGFGAFFQVDGAQARVSLGSGTTSSALSTLSLNNGIANFDGNCSLGAGGTTITTTTAFTNNGSLWVDIYGGDGATTVNFGGGLTNNGSITIGNTSLGANAAPGATTSVTASGLTNNGSITVQGNAASGATNEAILDITGTVSAGLTGSLRVGGDADVELASKIASIGRGASLELDGAAAWVSLGAGTTDSALSGLSLSDGTLLLRGDTGYGAGGTTLTTTTGFTNAGSLLVDVFGGDGGSVLTLGGALANHGTTDIGNVSLSASTTVTANGLANNGSLVVQGNAASGATNEAILDITGTIRGTATGYTRVGGDADMELPSKIAYIGTGAWLELDGAEALVSLGTGTTSSALTGLSANNGTLLLRGNSGYGAGGVTLTTTTGFTNAGSLLVDIFGGDGGSAITFGGALLNHGTTDIGNVSLSASTTVTANGFGNNGSLTLQGNAAGGLPAAAASGLQSSVASGGSSEAILDITAAVAVTAAGWERIGGDADMELTNNISYIGTGAWLELDGAEARISLGSGTTNSALSGLSLNNGTLLLRGDSGFGAGGVTLTTTTGFTNAGTLLVDVFGGDGGSAITFGGALVNHGTTDLGNGSLSAPTTVTATALTNNGSLSLTGGNGFLAELVINGNATNAGTITIGASSELDVSGSTHSFAQNAGVTTVAGLLAANLIQANGGVIDFTSALTSGDGTGALRVGNSGTLEFGAAVDSSHRVTFIGDTGTLELGSPGSFAGTIAGFTGDDVIDLLNTTVTGISYSGSSTSGTLTVSGSGGTVAQLAFVGDYTTASFITVSDGHGGTEILDPPIGGTSSHGADSDLASLAAGVLGSSYSGPAQHPSAAGGASQTGGGSGFSQQADFGAWLGDSPQPSHSALTVPAWHF